MTEAECRALYNVSIEEYEEAMEGLHQYYLEHPDEFMDETDMEV